MSKKSYTKPLVSIVIITYNSERFVLETLESAKSQTYENIELIISDDGSKDSTIDICQDWITENKNRFVRTELITVEKNTGISANFNRGYKASLGEWIKFIAGDDILYPRAIKSNIEFILKEKSSVSLVISSISIFRDSKENILYNWPKTEFPHSINSIRLLLLDNYIKAPGVFIEKKLMDYLEGYNEKYPMLEDYPFWIRCLTNSYKFHFNPEVLVRYRLHSQSISLSSTPSPIFFDSLYSFHKDIIFPMMLKNKYYLDYYICSFEYKLLNLEVYSKNNFSILVKISRKIISKIRVIYTKIISLLYQ